MAARIFFNPNGVASCFHHQATTPLGLFDFIHVSQGSSCLATLGFAPESLWDSGLGGTGYQPVSSGHWPDEMAERVVWNGAHRFAGVVLIPSGRLPLGTGG